MKVILHMLIVLMACSLWGCVKQPSVETVNGKVSFKHDSLTVNTCSDCHEATRPTVLSGPAHGDGNDCSQCHIPDTNKGWNDVTDFDHSTDPSTCNQCHSVSDFTPVAHEEKGDCKSCHSHPDWNSVDTESFHTPTPVSCISCHSIDNVTPTPPAEYHSNPNLDCASCHTYPDWSDAIFEHGDEHIQPGKCSECHSEDRPSSGDWMSQAYNSSTETSYENTDSHYGKADCFACHSTTRNFKDWDSESNSHKDAMGLKIQSCLPCHYQSKEPGNSGSLNSNNNKIEKHSGKSSWFKSPIFDMSISEDEPGRYGSHGNCFYCHTDRRSFSPSCEEDGFNPNGDCTKPKD